MSINIPAVLDAQARLYGSRPCVTVVGESRSFEELRLAAASSAVALARRGVEHGDRVVIVARNDIRLVELILGCLWLGAVVVPVNTAWRGRQLAHVIEDSQPACVVTDQEFIADLETVAPPSELKLVALIRSESDEPPRLWGRIPQPLVAGADEPLPLRPIPPGELAAVIYTSGTTGVSKGVMCPAAQLYWWTNIMRETLRLGEASVLYSTLPLFHINAIATVFMAIATGSRIVLDDKFSASRYWQRAEAEGATHVALLGAMAGMLLAHEPAESDLRHGVTTAFAPDMPANLWDAFLERFVVEEVVAAYAGTETNQVIAATGQRRSAPGYMGWVVEGYQAQVIDEFDCPVPDGTPGELVLRTDLPHAFCLGYYNRPEETLRVSRNLWWHTGDRVVREADGRFRFVDRLKDMIRRRGENISSWEVEEALLMHPDVA
ncbi:ATP-dependent acyl-CoA ligase [soil metagenome]